MTSVDAELFSCLQDAVNFVAERGGGVVRTELVGTLYANGLKLPKGVVLAPMPPADLPAPSAAPATSPGAPA